MPMSFMQKLGATLSEDAFNAMREQTKMDALEAEKQRQQKENKLKLLSGLGPLARTPEARAALEAEFGSAYRELYGSEAPSGLDWTAAGKTKEQRLMQTRLGDRVLIQDPITGEVLQEYKVGATPRMLGEPSPPNTGTDEMTGLTRSDKSKMIREFVENKAATRMALSTYSNIIKTLEENPGALTTAGTLARVAENVRANVSAMLSIPSIQNAYQTNIATNKLTWLSPEQVPTETWGKLANASASMKALVFQAALMTAGGFGQAGRNLTDRDLALFIQGIGADVSDPNQLISRLSSFADTMNNKIAIEGETVGRDAAMEEYTSFVGMAKAFSEKRKAGGGRQDLNPPISLPGGTTLDPEKQRRLDELRQKHGIGR